MKIKTLLVLMLITVSSIVKAQNPITTITVDSITVIDASVSNLNYMLQLSFEDWERALTNLGYGAKTYSIDDKEGRSVSLFKSTGDSKEVHSVIKSAHTISIDWYDPGNTMEVFKSIMAELKPFYVGLYHGSRTYQVKDGSITYQYVIVKYASGETIILKRS